MIRFLCWFPCLYVPSKKNKFDVKPVLLGILIAVVILLSGCSDDGTNTSEGTSGKSGNTNTAPTLTGTPNAATEDSFYSYTFVAEDPDAGDTLTFFITGEPAWLFIDSFGVISGTPDNGDVGTTNGVEVTVTDSSGASAAVTFDLIVANTNDAPSITGAPLTAVIGSFYSYTFVAEDPDVGDNLTFSIAGEPAWLSIDSNGVLNGTPAIGDVGTTVGVEVTVTDNSGASAAVIFDLSVVSINTAPTITGTPLSATEDSAYSHTFTATDPDAGDTLTFTLTGEPAWLSIDSNGVLSGTPTNGDVGTTVGVEAKVTDSAGANNTMTFDLTVANTNDSPVVVTPINDQSALASPFPIIIDLSPHFSDVDAGDALTYSVTANTNSSALTANLVGSTLTLTAGAGFGRESSITITATDLSLTTATDTFLVVLSRSLYSNGQNWNDYVKNDGADRFSATNTACDGSETGGYGACIHGGEALLFDTGNATGCGSRSAADALSAFRWVCDDSGATTVFKSIGLRAGVLLSDLIDFATPTWKKNQLTVTGGAGYTSPLEKWWKNPLLVDNDGGSLATAGTIYLITSDPSAYYTIDASKVGFVVKPSVTLSGADTNGSLVFASSKNFLWVEGSFDATGENFAAYWAVVKFSVMRGVNAEKAIVEGVYLFASTNNSLTKINAANNGFHGVHFYDSSNNILTLSTAGNNGESGVYLDQSSNNNRLEGISVANNGKYGVYLYISSSNNLTSITAANNGIEGVYLAYYSNNNSLTGITAVNNVYNGVYLDTSSFNRLTGVTATNNGQRGVLLNNSTFSRLMGVTVANNLSGGLGIYSSNETSLTDITATNHPFYGFSLSSSNITLSGLLMVGNNGTNCYVFAESDSPGLADDVDAVDDTHSGLCLKVAPSTFVLVTGKTLASSFVGKVGGAGSLDPDGDDANANDDATPGKSLYDNITDWTGLENIFRSWGKDGSAFPDQTNQSICVTGDTCRIWDWSLDNGPWVIMGKNACPVDGNDTLTHIWSDFSTTTYLNNAVEIGGDGIGNDNSMCESGETCFITPNFASYQGHGGLVSANIAFPGTLTCTNIPAGATAVDNIYLKKYKINGY